MQQKFNFTETPSTTNQRIHIDTYVNSKHSFINFIDKFSKHVVSFYLEDHNSQTIIEKFRQYLTIKEKPKKFVFDNEYNTRNIKDFCVQENIEYHITKPSSHTGNFDVERFHNNITERIRTLNLEEKFSIRIQMLKAVRFYNNTFHSTIKATPQEVQEQKINHRIIHERLEQIKNRIISKRNMTREDYTEKEMKSL